MVITCYICKRRYEKKSDISFHLFPKTTNIRTAWEKACKLQKPVPKTARICSEHFRKDSFEQHKDYSVKLLKQSAIPSIFSWNTEDNLTTNNSINQSYIQHNVASMSKQDQNCAHKNVSFLCEQTISCDEEHNEEYNLLKMPSINDTDREHNLCLSSSETPKQQLKNTKSLKIHKIYRSARIGDLTMQHFSIPQRALSNLEMVQRKINEQARKIKLLQDQNRRLLKKVSSLQDLRMYRTYNLRQKCMKFEILKYLRLTHSKSKCNKLER